MTVRRMRPALGTFVEIVIQDPAASISTADQAFECIQMIHDGLSFHQPTSYLNQLNQNPFQWIAMPQAIVRILRLAQLITLRSHQHFDCSIGHRLVAAGALPSPISKPQAKKTLPQATGAFLQFSGSAVKLTQPVLLVLDGIAKGYAVDLAVKSLKHNGVKSAWVNAGGDLRIFGGTPAVFHIRHQQQILASVQLSNMALATSATEQRSEYPSLLLNKKNQAVGGCHAVAAPWAFLADALTKAIATCPAHEVAALLAPFQAQLVFQQK